jgi:hypothetical protein
MVRTSSCPQCDFHLPSTSLWVRTVGTMERGVRALAYTTTQPVSGEYMANTVCIGSQLWDLCYLSTAWWAFDRWYAVTPLTLEMWYTDC